MTTSAVKEQLAELLEQSREYAKYSAELGIETVTMTEVISEVDAEPSKTTASPRAAITAEPPSIGFGNPSANYHRHTRAA